MKKKFVASLLCTSMLCLSMCTIAYTEDAPMTEEEIFYAEDYAVEAQTEEETLIVAEEEEYLEEDGLIAAEEDEVLEAVSDGDVRIDEKTFPDVHFRIYLSGYAEGDVLKSSTISGITEMYIYNPLLEDLTGIKVFTNLQELYCHHNKLTSLDLSGCTALTMLDCSNNNLTSLDLSGCRNLSELYCYKNQLTSLDISTCKSLTKLDCSGNKLKTLDVSLCRALKELCESTTPTIKDIDGYKYYQSPGVALFVDPDVEIITVHTHTWDTGRVTKAATTTSTGIRTYTCTVCGGTKKGIIPKLKDKITITKKPGIKKPAATKSKITVKWKHFKHTSKKTRKIWKTIKKVQVQCATDSGFSNIVKDVKIGKGKTKYAVKGLAKKTTYYVRVRYFDGTGYSDWSKVKKVKTK